MSKALAQAIAPCERYCELRVVALPSVSDSTVITCELRQEEEAQ